MRDRLLEILMTLFLLALAYLIGIPIFLGLIKLLVWIVGKIGPLIY